ncbi:uncharacterized protein LOC135383358 [Ornithodoros turicata]|uniref:uncharacterized protein LOC135383358 n=1 Tax=Ornithodoros turicata TaxID=34597 RepID=UPI003139D0B3
MRPSSAINVAAVLITVLWVYVTHAVEIFGDRNRTSETQVDDLPRSRSFSRFFSDSSYVALGTYEGESVLVGFSLNMTHGVYDCDVVNGRVPVDAALKYIPGRRITHVNEQDLVLYLVSCTNFLRVNLRTRSGIWHFLHQFAMYPGTKWCGYGDIAESYDDFGEARTTDTCCRDHDKAGDTIAAFGEKHGVFNSHLYTMSKCESDRKFYECLLADRTSSSGNVGLIYFDILRISCYDYAPEVKCTSWFLSWFQEETCWIDQKTAKHWQTFSPPSFSSDYMNKWGATPTIFPAFFQRKDPAKSWKLLYKVRG